VVHEQNYTPFAVAEGLTLYHPSRRVEHIGFHESNHDGARQMEIVATTVVPLVLESRERLTGSHTAADIVADPYQKIRSPVTGTVIRGGSYTLYCDTRDHYVVIEPDERPGWEVKVLHMTGLNVRKGDRVVAGSTVLAPGPHVLPFKSQVDEMKTSDPAWPHVHIEVVDPSIPDRPSPGGGCRR
jgi:biotin carboxyl carrier protein